jgi:hypothetical protein
MHPPVIPLPPSPPQKNPHPRPFPLTCSASTATCVRSFSSMGYSSLSVTSNQPGPSLPSSSRPTCTATAKQHTNSKALCHMLHCSITGWCKTIRSCKDLPLQTNSNIRTGYGFVFTAAAAENAAYPSFLGPAMGPEHIWHMGCQWQHDQHATARSDTFRCKCLNASSRTCRTQVMI